MEAYRILVMVHGGIGIVALLAFWTASLSRKGSPRHKAAGRIYVLSMLGIIATALPITAVAFARGTVLTGTFLSFLVVITATALWLGWRAIRRKSDESGFRGGSYNAVALANVLAGSVVLWVGLRLGVTVLIGFPLIGIYLGLQMLWRTRHPLNNARWWLREHFTAMLACGVATHIAFLSIGLTSLLESAGLTPYAWVGSMAWFAPLGVAIAAIVRLNGKYFPRKSLSAART